MGDGDTPVTEPSALIDKCYAAVLESWRWAPLMNEVSDYLDANGAAIISHDPSRTSATLHSENLMAADADFKNYWWRYESRISRAKTLGLQPGLIVTDPMIFSDGERAKDPYFQEFCRAYRMDEIAAYFAKDPLGGLMTVSIFRENESGAFDRKQIDRLRHVGPHVARAFQLTVELNAARARSADLPTGLGELGIGAILLDEAGRVRSINEPVPELVRGCMSVVRGATVKIVPSNDRQVFARLIAGALPDGGGSANSSMILRSVDGAPHVLVEVMPIRLSDPFLDQIGARRGGALLIVRSLKPSTGHATARYLLQMGLTKAEAAVAVRIGRGMTPKEVADEGSVSAATVRFQLRSIFAKLAVRRQSELAVLVTKLDTISREGG